MEVELRERERRGHAWSREVHVPGAGGVVALAVGGEALLGLTRGFRQLKQEEDAGDADGVAAELAEECSSCGVRGSCRFSGPGFPLGCGQVNGDLMGDAHLKAEGSAVVSEVRGKGMGDAIQRLEELLQVAGDVDACGVVFPRAYGRPAPKESCPEAITSGSGIAFGGGDHEDEAIRLDVAHEGNGRGCGDGGCGDLAIN